MDFIIKEKYADVTIREIELLSYAVEKTRLTPELTMLETDAWEEVCEGAACRAYLESLGRVDGLIPITEEEHENRRFTAKLQRETGETRFLVYGDWKKILPETGFCIVPAYADKKEPETSMVSVNEERTRQLRKLATTKVENEDAILNEMEETAREMVRLAGLDASKFIRDTRTLSLMMDEGLMYYGYHDGEYSYSSSVWPHYMDVNDETQLPNENSCFFASLERLKWPKGKIPDMSDLEVYNPEEKKWEPAETSKYKYLALTKRQADMLREKPGSPEAALLLEAFCEKGAMRDEELNALWKQRSR